MKRLQKGKKVRNANLSRNQSGQTTGSVGQDDTVKQQGSSNWEDQAKYHQSEKDKLYAENQSLKKYEKVGKFLESRPDIVQNITEQVKGGQPTQAEKVALNKEEFDPWEAYNDPSSKSYKFREQELKDTINGAVENAVSGVKEQMGMNNLNQELSKKGLNEEQIESFVEFAKKNPAEYGIDGALKMWDAVENGNTEQVQEASNNPYDQIRQQETAPPQGGVLTGQQPVTKSESENLWDGVLGASRVGNKIP